ncbi:hypothetical protein ZYGM_000758 [Zygosaccharomyces mellis]|uniref:SET domain-containing protein n=1 Tax=Zygosaccharomyces mellis TaxID=42258 RepID=A0A4C2EAY0_9SACH|nr:hypothetical protein ZYGM_000758 [Zygosaccharomyces mellis]
MSQEAFEVVQWARSKGASIPSQIDFVRDESKGICTVCKEDLQGVKIRIPSSIIIGRKDARGIFAPRYDGDNTGLKFLLSFWKSENNVEFGPYLRNLPSQLDSALIWSPDEWQLLRGTNLGNSIKEKLSTIYSEWTTWIKDRGLSNDSLDFDEFDDQQLYQDFLKPASRGQFSSWSSFSAFLWSHLILLSRAFPEYIIDPHCHEGSVILLPLLDLLNHSAHSKVQWYSEEGAFCLEQNDGITKGQELFNNYGAKGNEELLAGYGFVQEDNEFDYVALKIKLPLKTIENILENEPRIKLPTLDDYTTFAFEKSTDKKKDKADASYFENGIRFFINTQNENCLNPLLDLFSYLSKTDVTENWTDLRPRLQGLQSLRAALKLKQDQASILPDELKPSAAIHPYRQYCAGIYRQGQLRVLKHAITSLKQLEKDLFTQHKHQLLNLKKILKDDARFVDEELPNLFQDKDQDEVSFDDTFELLVLWILAKLKNDSFQEKHEWIRKQFKVSINKEQTITEEAELLYSHFFSEQQTTTTKITLEELNDAYNFVLNNSFTRSASSSSETILVQSA